MALCRAHPSPPAYTDIRSTKHNSRNGGATNLLQDLDLAHRFSMSSALQLAQEVLTQINALPLEDDVDAGDVGHDVEADVEDDVGVDSAEDTPALRLAREVLGLVHSMPQHRGAEASPPSRQHEGSARHRRAAYNARRVRATFVSDQLGEDTIGKTNVNQVARLHKAFVACHKRKFSNAIPAHHAGRTNLQRARNVRPGQKRAREFVHANKVPPEQADSRLSVLHTYYCWGLQPNQVRGADRGAAHLSSGARLRYLLGSCQNAWKCP